MARGSRRLSGQDQRWSTVALGAPVIPPRPRLAFPVGLRLLAAGTALAQETNLPKGWIPPASIGLFDEPQLLEEIGQLLRRQPARQASANPRTDPTPKWVT